MHRRHRGVPGRGRLGHPPKELQRVEARSAEHRAAGVQGSQHGRDQAVNVKQRHDVETTVLGAEGQAPRHASGGRADVGVAQRNELGPRRRPRSVEHECCFAGLREARRVGLPANRVAGQLERPGGALGDRLQLGDRDAELAGRGACRRVGVIRVDHQQPGAEVRQVKVALFLAVSRVEGRRRGPGSDTDERARHLGSVGKHDGDGVAAPDAELVQPGDGLRRLSPERVVGHRAATGGAECRGVPPRWLRSTIVLASGTWRLSRKSRRPAQNRPASAEKARSCHRVVLLALPRRLAHHQSSSCRARSGCALRRWGGTRGPSTVGRRRGSKPRSSS